LKLAGTSFETNDDYDFNGVNANDAMLLIIITTYKWFLRTSMGEVEGSPL